VQITWDIVLVVIYMQNIYMKSYVLLDIIGCRVNNKKKRLDLTCFISYISYNINLVKAGAVAQLGEHLPCTEGVAGSIPVSSTK
jgi:hypothetical protein